MKNPKHIAFFVTSAIFGLLPLAEAEVHVVRPGQTISGIASAYNISEKALLRANPRVSDPNSIQIGQRLIIPGAGGGAGAYRVKKNDTLRSIAKRFGTTVDRIAQANGIRDVDRIEAGQLLILPGGEGRPDTARNSGVAVRSPESSKQPHPASPIPFTYTVSRNGETLATIAEATGLLEADLRQHNPGIADLASSQILARGTILKTPYAPLKFRR